MVDFDPSSAWGGGDEVTAAIAGGLLPDVADFDPTLAWGGGDEATAAIEAVPTRKRKHMAAAGRADDMDGGVWGSFHQVSRKGVLHKPQGPLATSMRQEAPYYYYWPILLTTGWETMCVHHTIHHPQPGHNKQPQPQAAKAL